MTQILLSPEETDSFIENKAKWDAFLAGVKSAVDYANRLHLEQLIASRAPAAPSAQPEPKESPNGNS